MLLCVPVWKLKCSSLTAAIPYFLGNIIELARCWLIFHFLWSICAVASFAVLLEFGLFDYRLRSLSLIVVVSAADRHGKRADFVLQSKQLFCPAAFPPVEYVFEGNALVVSLLRLIYPFDLYLRLHVHLGAGLREDVRKLVQHVLPKHGYKVFRTLERKISVVFHLLVRFFVDLRLPRGHLLY